MRMYNNLDYLFENLSKSKFRSSFHLRKYMIKYIDQKGLEVIRSHAYDFVYKRLKPAYPLNDGRQTPMKGHPVFIAQHATGTCCRSCLAKWHNIPASVELSEKQVDYIVEIIMRWIEKKYKS